MIGGYPVPIRQVWDHRIATPTPILVQNARHWLGALPTSADAENGIFACTARPRMTTGALIEEVSETPLGSSASIDGPGTIWEMFRLVWSCAGTVTSNT